MMCFVPGVALCRLGLFCVCGSVIPGRGRVGTQESCRDGLGVLSSTGHEGGGFFSSAGKGGRSLRMEMCGGVEMLNRFFSVSLLVISN